MLIVMEETEMRGKKPDCVNLTNGTFIAGGSIRRWFTGEPQKSDIDIFGSESALVEFVKENNLGNPISENKNATTYKLNGKAIQCIKHFSGSVDDTLDCFDYKHCQFAWDGETIYTTLEAVVCALRRSLMVHKIQEGFELDSLRRAFKYQKQGYEPCLGCLKLIADSFRDVDEQQLQNQFEISPGGGKRVLRFD